MIKNIGVLTSGGDSPGMNAAARAVVRTVLYEGGKVWGIYDGYRGLLDEKMEELTSRSVADILQRGGTFLGTARCKRFMTPEGRMEAYENMKKRGIEGLVVIGGDGSLTRRRNAALPSVSCCRRYAGVRNAIRSNKGLYPCPPYAGHDTHKLSQ